jgi:hypothetical protein
MQIPKAPPCIVCYNDLNTENQIAEKNEMTIEGKTYTICDSNGKTEQYYTRISELTDLLLHRCPEKRALLLLIHKAGKQTLLQRLRMKEPERKLFAFIRKTLAGSLSIYTKNVEQHLKRLPAAKRFDDTLVTKEEQYHLYMIEIELVNRIYRDQFKNCEHKVALIAHCLRDFRPECRSVSGDFEAVCGRCSKDCYVHLGSLLLEKYGITPYISVEMDQEALFKRLKHTHPNIGALGIACIPELAMGMRLCIQLGIPPVGIPLDANRCARWMSQAHETSFSLVELENLLH